MVMFEAYTSYVVDGLPTGWILDPEESSRYIQYKFPTTAVATD